MGGGTYSSTSRLKRAVEKGHASVTAAVTSGLADDTYKAKSIHDVFERRSINNAMSPEGLQVRESRDSAEHPNSIAIIIALDVTGSMGSVPHHLVQSGLPKLMDTLMEKGVADPQVLFLGVGDHEYDRAPLQVGQFESSDELLDKWLTEVYLEGGGGNNAGESYALAWYLASQHTSIDCFEKRRQKGFLFTIGDEPPLKNISEHALRSIMGEGQYQDDTAESLLRRAKESYECFHVHIRETSSGSRQDRVTTWRDLIQDGLLIAQNHQDVPDMIAQAIIQSLGSSQKSLPSVEEPGTPGYEPPPML